MLRVEVAEILADRVQADDAELTPEMGKVDSNLMQKFGRAESTPGSTPSWFQPIIDSSQLDWSQ